MDFSKAGMDTEYTDVRWLDETGLGPDALKSGFEAVLREHAGASTAVQKANLFAFLCRRARVAVDAHDRFQDKLNHGDLLRRFNWSKHREIRNGAMQALADESDAAWEEGYWTGHEDFGHVCPGWIRLLDKGFSGILADAQARLASCTDPAQREFYETVRITYAAIVDYLNRLADAVEPVVADSAAVLRTIAARPPETTREALQTLYSFFALHEFVAGGRDRSMGRLDKMLYRFYQADLARGVGEAELRESIRFFLYKIWVARVPFDQPIELGGMDSGGAEVTNELSRMIIEEYDGLDIHSPKIHVRVSANTPTDFLVRVVDTIRRGHSSILLCNDDVVIRSLEKAGISRAEAEDYVMIGCYEAAAYGCEIPCTGTAGMNLLKAFEKALADGVQTYGELYDRFAYYTQYAIDRAMTVVREWERHYREIYPDALLSGTFDSCLARGRDAYDDGVKYNNSSLNVASIGSTVDAFMMLKKFVFDEHEFTLDEFRKVLAGNWRGHEKLRRRIRACPKRYGNGDPEADALTRKISDKVGDAITGQPNGRGGVFKAGCFSINHNVRYGQKCGATPDGRFSGDTLSKNLCPGPGMEFGGITAIINSVATSIDAVKFPNGTVMDIVFHPTAVSGEDGLLAMLGVYMTFFTLGGFAMHGNVFDAAVLREAQAHPEDYRNLQVRVCGWNVFFVHLSRAEQDDFIRQAAR